MKEIYLPIKDYESLYEVSNLGNVKSLRRNIILIPNKRHGYVTVELPKKNAQLIHRLVGKAFLLNPENKPYINHINGIKNDNRVSNLEWCTPKENTIHAYKLGLQVQPKRQKQNQPNQKEIIDIINNEYYFSIREANKATLLKRDTIQRSLRLDVPVKNGGYHFKYI